MRRSFGVGCNGSAALNAALLLVLRFPWKMRGHVLGLTMCKADSKVVR
jgi:hypothetical protein